MALPSEKSRYQNHSISETRHDTEHPISAFFRKTKSGEAPMVWYGFLVILLMVAFIVPHVTLIAMVVTILSLNFLFNRNNNTIEMPMRVPIHAEVLDGSKSTANDRYVHSSNRHKFKPTATTYMGVDIDSKEQVWFDDDDLLTHIMILGTTKSGKTYLILLLMLQALIKNGGFFYIDGKGDIVTLKFICQLSRRFGRDADLIVLSFLPYQRPQYGNDTKPTNSLNIMRTASPTMISEVIISMLDGQEDMWKGRTISFVTALMPALCAARDAGIIELSASEILNMTELKKLEDFCWKTCPESKNPQMIQASKAIAHYLTNIPSYDKNKYLNQQEQETTTKDQHGYVTMQLLRALNDLSYNYGHIFGQESSDLDVQDAVFNRRNVVVSLPALGRSPSTLAMLGRIVVSAIKQMGSLALGSKVEGSVRLNVDARPTNARNIYGLFFDEVGYYMVSGMSIIPAQVRAFKLYAVFAGQTYSNIKKADANEAEEIWNNTNVKLFGRLVGGEDTEDFRKIQGLAGTEYVWRTKHKTRKIGDLYTSYRNSDGVELSEEKRINVQALSSQQDGGFLAVMSKKSSEGSRDGGVAISYMQSMNPVPADKLDYIFINSFVYVPKKPLKSVGTADHRLSLLDEMIKEGIHEYLHRYHRKEVLDNQERKVSRDNKLADMLTIMSNHFENNYAMHHITDKTFLVHKYFANSLQDDKLGVNAPQNTLEDGVDLLGNELFIRNRVSTEQVIERSINNILALRQFKEGTLDLAIDGTNRVSVANARLALDRDEQNSLEVLPVTPISELSVDDVLQSSYAEAQKLQELALKRLEMLGSTQELAEKQDLTRGVDLF